MRRTQKPSAENLALITSMLSVYWPDISATALLKAMDELDLDRPLAVPRSVTIAEAARELKVSERTVRNMIRDGRLKSMKSGKIVRVTADSMRRLLADDETA